MGLPINPVVSGLLKGYALAQQLRDSAMQQEEFQRRKMMQDRQMQVQDIQTQEMLNSAGRPIEGGTVALDDRAGDVGGVKAEYEPDYRRKPDAARSVKYKTRDGQTIERELYTPEEQAKRSLDSTIAKARAMNDLSIDKAAALRKLDVVDLPGVGSVPTKAVPYLTADANRRAADTRAADANTSHENIAAATNTSRENIAASNQTTQTTVANTRANATMGAATLRSKNAGAASEAATIRDRGRVRAELSKLEGKEAPLHTRRRELGSALATPEGTKFAYRNKQGALVETKMNALIRSRLKTEFEDATEQVNTIIDSKKRLVQEMQGASGAPAAPPPPKNPYR